MAQRVSSAESQARIPQKAQLTGASIARRKESAVWINQKL